MLLHIVALSGLPRAAREGKSLCTSNFQVSACFTFATVSLDKVNHRAKAESLWKVTAKVLGWEKGRICNHFGWILGKLTYILLCCCLFKSLNSFVITTDIKQVVGRLNSKCFYSLMLHNLAI